MNAYTEMAERAAAPACEPAQYTPQENHVEEEEDEGSPVKVHVLRKDDTLKQLSKEYGVKLDVLMLVNGIHELTAKSLDRKFIVIPSTGTFQYPIWDLDEERNELARNLMMLLNEDYGKASQYLERANYVLPDAIELYYFDLA